MRKISAKFAAARGRTEIIRKTFEFLLLMFATRDEMKVDGETRRDCENGLIRKTCRNCVRTQNRVHQLETLGCAMIINPGYLLLCGLG